MVFPVAQIETAVWIPPVTAFVISFFTSMGGVSGAFLLLPFQVSVLGYTSPSVSATNQLFNIVAIPSGVWRYWKEGRMVWPLTWIVIFGTLPGVLIGAVVRVVWLPDPRHFKLFAAGVLLYIGGRLAWDLVKNRKRAAKEAAGPVDGGGAVRVVRFDVKRLEYSFQGEVFGAPFWGIFALSFIVGIVGGIYGIGGGSIIAPFFVTFFRLPVYTIAGAALMGTFVTSVAGVAFYQAMAPFYPNISVAPDWLLGLLFGVGGMAGMYLGARCQRFVPADAIKWMLAVVMLFTAAQYVAGFLGF
ncbi:MAG: sulfite exporter TauE/SafE family protein [Thermodesulfobacteriota bacterium]|nr:sulfite exporter TauE/SafE family protein [Thermodesulfobacteriota bacterium]